MDRDVTLRWQRWAVLLAAVPFLSGCAAVVAVPFLAGSMLFARDQVRVRAATPVPPEARLAKGTVHLEDAALAPAPGVTITDLKELPPPSIQDAARPDDPWQRFVSYALSRQPRIPVDGQSALLARPETLEVSERRPCLTRHPAVVIDLDEGKTPFAPETLKPAEPSVAAGLAQLRQAGFVVLWISQLPASKAPEVARALQEKGFDPEGQDQLLLIRNKDDRKEVLRFDAMQDVCILAIAGDERGDFDELFDYLRNPAGAAALYPLMGAGWFLVPFPVAGATPAN